jgi:hypothetical protein
MRGTQFLSACLKLNPVFTVVLAVGFTGVAAVGVKHIDNVTLTKLIPLHLQSIFAPDPPASTMLTLPEFGLVQNVVRDALEWPATSTGFPPAPVELPAPMLPEPVVVAHTWEGQPVPLPHEPTGMGRPVSNKTQSAALPGPDNAAVSLPAKDPVADPSPIAAPLRLPALGSVIAADIPLLEPSLLLAESTPPGIADAVLPFDLSAPLPEPIFPGPTHFSRLVPNFEAAGSIVATSEPPLGLLFAGLLPVLIVLRGSALRSRRGVGKQH